MRLYPSLFGDIVYDGLVIFLTTVTRRTRYWALLLDILVMLV